MSDSTLARRTEIAVKIDGVDISADINKYLLSMTYTDHEEDKTDDLQISLDDREGIWLTDWLSGRSESDTRPTLTERSVLRKGARGEAVKDMQRLLLANGQTLPIYGVDGIFMGETEKALRAFQKSAGLVIDAICGPLTWAALEGTGEESGGAKGAVISAVIIQRNWEGDGKDRVLDCGTFEIDGVDGSGPPAQASIKATSLPYSSTVRTEKKTRAWENSKLSAIAYEIAKRNGMKCMFESSYDPTYTRREQVQISDIVFLQGLCKDAGISLKVSANIIILFDAAAYEQKEAVREIRRGAADVKSYRFGTSSTDTNYSKCHVSYTDPQTGQTIEYTYTPRDADKDGPALEINEKVKTREEARQLAMKRLRQKNKAEHSAEFTLVGDVRLVAGVTVEVIGWGMFDGKYIIETATHSVTASGYTLQVKLRRVLEGY